MQRRHESIHRDLGFTDGSRPWIRPHRMLPETAKSANVIAKHAYSHELCEKRAEVDGVWA